MSKKTKTGLIIGFIVVAVIAFYAGDKYGNNQNTAPTQGANSFARGGAGGAQRGMRTGGGFVSGQIVSKDAASITVQLNAPVGPNNGTTTSATTGSKIVFYTGNTSIMKTTDGTADDLTPGKQVSITGTANPDGSVNAQSIQIRPVKSTPAQQ
jgi:type II secretory pathway pseudopilin PulG